MQLHEKHGEFSTLKDIILLSMLHAVNKPFVSLQTILNQFIFHSVLYIVSELQLSKYSSFLQSFK